MSGVINCLIGPSGCGKSTTAKQMLDSIGPDKSVIIGRDKLRELLFGYSESSVNKYYESKDFVKCEEEISLYERELIKTSLRSGKVVISDNTNLKVSYLNKYKQYGVLVNFIPVEATLQQCQDRNIRRIRQVDPVIIIRQYRQFENLKKNFDFQSFTPSEWKKPEYNWALPDCYIFDIDGTLADHKNKRSPYEWTRVGEDSPRENIVKLQVDLACMSANNHDRLQIIICSGRDEICRPETEKWLEDNRIYYDELHMRPLNNQEADFLIKERMWADISKRYNIVALFDDRDQVVDHARRCGLDCLQVNYGSF